MILLFGGTADTVPIANSLVELGEDILISTLTSELSLTDLDPLVETRSGELDFDGICQLIKSMSVDIIVDATHPYASSIQNNAIEASQKLNVPIIRYQRPSTNIQYKYIYRVRDHLRAVKVLNEISKRPFLTIGANNIATYTFGFKNKSNIVARVLDTKESLKKTLDSGILQENVLSLRGPFTKEDNIKHMVDHKVDALVTKDGGEKGLVVEKIEAAKELGVPVVIIERPISAQVSNMVYRHSDIVSKIKEIRG